MGMNGMQTGSSDGRAVRPASQADSAAWRACFGRMDASLNASGLQVTDSGSTCVVSWLDLQAGVGSVTTANVGDSRAVLGRRKGQGWEAVQLSSDHCLERRDEAVSGPIE